jgi:ABC-type Fe3+/spermidine/putrescine transport system ATPase subunit
MIRVQGLGYQVGAFSLRRVTLQVEPGEYCVLLGPTGSGKTLLIECLCGLLRPSAGTIEIGGRDVTHLAPRLRGIGYVPQHSGLFPHLNVRRNITFPLRTRHLTASERRERLEPLAELLRLKPLLDRWPAHLSGGERQKVALARALAARPRLLLLDEPVSALDEPSREHLCAELRRIQRQLQVTTIHVSHSIEEAFSVGDRAAVLHEGRLVQAAPLAELLRRPASEFVARFFRSENLFQATAAPLPDGGTEVAFAGHTLRTGGRHEGAVTFVIRPEALQVHPPEAQVANGVPAVLKQVSDRGPYQRLEFDAGVPIVAYTTARADSAGSWAGQACVVAFPSDAIHILPVPDLGPLA